MKQITDIMLIKIIEKKCKYQEKLINQINRNKNKKIINRKK